MDAFSQINWLAIPVAGFITLFVGGLWYGPLFGKAWMEEFGVTEEEIKASGSPGPAMIKSFIASLVLGIGMSLIIIWSGVPAGDYAGGAVVGAVTALLVVGGAVFPNYAFESKTMRHFAIHIGNITVSMVLIGAMLAAWR